MNHEYSSVRLTDLYMFCSIVSQPLVHLVTDAQHVMLDAQISNHLELFGLVNLPFRRMWHAVSYILLQIHIVSTELVS